MVSMQRIKRQIQSIRGCLDNFLLNALPDWSPCSRFLRPGLATVLGMKCGRQTYLRKGNYYGNLRNIDIGDGTRIGRDVFFDALDRITLGSNVFVGFQASFITSAHEVGDAGRRCGALYARSIVVEDGVWIGACAKIGPGVTLGAGSVISVGAVVMRSVPANSVVAGVPARVVMQLEGGENSQVSEGRTSVEQPA
jgi:acetyltransferase-like isoleucine patch superfamily enzyme